MDKEYLYGEYLANDRKQRSLMSKAAHKALDIPHDDDVQIHANRSGLGWKELAVIVAGLLGAGGIGATLLDRLPSQTPESPPPVTAPADPGAMRVRVFWGDQEILPGAAQEATVASPEAE